MGLCDQPGISERALVSQLVPLLMREAERIGELMLPGPGDLPAKVVDPALLEQLEQTRALAVATGLPELRAALLALEDKAGAAEAQARQSIEVEQGRQTAARQLTQLLPTIRPDVYTMPVVRRQVMRAIEPIEVRGGEVVSVTLAGG
ncbi:MAG: hypothetical protein NTW83_12315 [Cyanobacteria bacterium]|nr:hypothetical protein [Cyanobacteriota bacterium]